MPYPSFFCEVVPSSFAGQGAFPNKASGKKCMRRPRSTGLDASVSGRPTAPMESGGLGIGAETVLG